MKKIIAVVGFAFSLAAGCDVEDVNDVEDLSELRDDTEFVWVDAEDAFYSVDSSASAPLVLDSLVSDDVDDPESVVPEPTSLEDSANCCSATCPYGSCYVPSSYGNCSCKCKSGQPKCSGWNPI